MSLIHFKTIFIYRFLCVLVTLCFWRGKGIEIMGKEEKRMEEVIGKERRTKSVFEHQYLDFTGTEQKTDEN